MSAFNRHRRFLLSLLPGIVLALLAVVPARADIPVPPGISPEAQEFYRQMQARPATSPDLSDPAVIGKLRTGLGKMFLANARRVRTDYTLEPVDAGGVPAIWVRTPEPVRKGRALLYIHGGGFILGSAKTDLSLPLQVGPAAGIAVLSVDYRLAPEHPFPAAVDDVVGAYRWLLGRGYAARDIGVFGDSAGGALALSLVLGARDAGLKLPGAVALLSPVTDLVGIGDTYTTLATLDPVLPGTTARLWEGYLAGRDPRQPLVSPLYGDLAGFPPLLIQAGGREVLLSDSLRLARKARASGVDVTLDVWDGMWHVFQGSSTIPESREAVAALGEFFRKHLDGRGGGSKR